jgi:hypothetical protein
MTEESIPELLARMERSHSEVIFYFGEHSGRCICGVRWPCSTARVVAHARSLEDIAAKLRENLDEHHENEDATNCAMCLWGQL